MVRSITNAAVLSAWESAYSLGNAARGLVLLGLAVPDKSVEHLLQYSIGQRDAALMQLRGKLFGSQLQALVSCPKCSERIELSSRVDDLIVPCEERTSVVEYECASALGPLQVRLPSCRDLVAIEQIQSPDARKFELLHRCVRTTEGLPADRLLIDAVAQDVSDFWSRNDPQSDIRFALECPSCECTWTSRFDIPSFLWHELDSWARRLMTEVHSLAFAFGWSEQSILEMSPWRRQVYLGMVRR